MYFCFLYHLLNTVAAGSAPRLYDWNGCHTVVVISRNLIFFAFGTGVKTGAWDGVGSFEF